MLDVEACEVAAVDEGLERLEGLLSSTPDVESLGRFLPEGLMEGLVARSAIASTFAASLELAREGKIKLRQSSPYGTIYLKPTGHSGKKRPRLGGPKAAKTESGKE